MRGILNANIIVDEELRDLLPPLTQDEYDDLEKSILKHGIMEAIKVWDSGDKTNNYYIIDGHNRWNICKKHNIGIEYWNIKMYDVDDFKTKNDVINWMIENQLGRRNLSISDRFEIVQKYKPILITKAKENLSAGGKGLTTLSKVNVRKEMADKVGVSEGTYSKLEKIYNSDNEEVKKKVKSGELSINKGFNEVKPEDEIAERLGKEHGVSAKTIKKNGLYAEAVDTIAENLGMDIRNKILNGEIKLTQDEVIKIGKMTPKEQQEFFECNSSNTSTLRNLNSENIFLIYNSESFEYIGTAMLAQLEDYTQDELISIIEGVLKETKFWENRFEDNLTFTLLERQTLLPKAEIEYYIVDDETDIEYHGKPNTDVNIGTNVLHSIFFGKLQHKIDEICKKSKTK